MTDTPGIEERLTKIEAKIAGIGDQVKPTPPVVTTTRTTLRDPAIIAQQFRTHVRGHEPGVIEGAVYVDARPKMIKERRRFDR